MKFTPIASERVWGGKNLKNKLGKDFEDKLIGESWEIADMGLQDSVVANGWLAGNTIGDLMETFLDRLVGENVYNFYGKQFPVLIKYLDIQEKLSLQIHPDDEVAAERYDSLGKSEIWYIVDAAPDAKIYMGFNRDVEPEEFYKKCLDGTAIELLNVVTPKKGDAIFVTPGTVHAAEGGILVAEIQESSDMTFRLYDWGREFNPETARETHLDEAFDLINFKKYDPSLFRKGPMWGEEASTMPCGELSDRSCDCKGDDAGCNCHHDEKHENGHEDTCGENCNCHHDHKEEDKIAEILVESPQFNVTKLKLTDPLHIYTEKFESFIIYMCVEGGASIQIAEETSTARYDVKKGETILVPAESPDFILVPEDPSTILLEVVTRPEFVDEYIDFDTEPYLEGEDYGI